MRNIRTGTYLLLGFAGSVIAWSAWHAYRKRIVTPDSLASTDFPAPSQIPAVQLEANLAALRDLAQQAGSDSINNLLAFWRAQPAAQTQ